MWVGTKNIVLAIEAVALLLLILGISIFSATCVPKLSDDVNEFMNIYIPHLNDELKKKGLPAKLFFQTRFFHKRSLKTLFLSFKKKAIHRIAQ